MTRLFTGFVSILAIFGGSFLTLMHTVIISRFCKLSEMVPDRKDRLRCEWLNIPYKINVASVEVTNKTFPKAYRIQGIEYVDSFNILSSKLKVQQALKSW